MPPRSLGNMARASAKTWCRGRAWLTASVARSQEVCSELNPQGAGNTAQALGKSRTTGKPAFAASSTHLVRSGDEFRVQEMVNSLWAFATAVALGFRLLDAICHQCRKRNASEFVAQDFSNLVQ
ncbi:unnamed protein product [Effrenium voratum]|nr:unnamed protein product [Effrenium voratum]